MPAMQFAFSLSNSYIIRSEMKHWRQPANVMKATPEGNHPQGRSKQRCWQFQKGTAQEYDETFQKGAVQDRMTIQISSRREQAVHDASRKQDGHHHQCLQIRNMFYYINLVSSILCIGTETLAPPCQRYAIITICNQMISSVSLFCEHLGHDL